MQDRIVQARRKLDRKLGELEGVQTRQVELIQEIEVLKLGVELNSKASIVLNSLADERQASVQSQIESLVTEGLHSIFDDSLSFHMVPSVRANKQVIDLVLRTTLPDKDTFETNVLDARGGGVSAVVGFLLRLVVLLLTKKGQSKLLILDETFSHLSEEYRPAVAEFIRQIVDKTDTQVIMVSHFEDLTVPADKIYHFSLSKTGESIIKEIK